MTQEEVAEASEAIGVMMMGFPFSSNMGAASVEAYLMAVEDYDLASVQEACRAFIKNKVPGRKPGHTVTAPELAQECERQQARLRWEAYTAEHVFIIEGSDEWRQMAIARGVSSFPTKEQDGKQGWYLPKHEVQQARMIELPKPVKSPALPNMRKM